MLLKIYFAGLIAFASGSQGEMHVLLVDARAGHELSDGTMMAPHVPLLLTTGVCSGDCGAGNQAVAEYLYGQRSNEEASAAGNLQRLGGLVGCGAVWRLDDSILSLEKPRISPRAGDSGLLLFKRQTTARGASPEDPLSFDWIANIAEIVPDSAKIDPDTLANRPSGGLITARLTLDSGTMKAYSLATIREDSEEKVPRLVFRPLGRDEREHAAVSPRAWANWVVAEIPFTGGSVSIVKENFHDGSIRRIQLRPREGETVVEMALINLPIDSFQTVEAHQEASMVGKHFELFYRLSATRPRRDRRPVPFVFRERSREPVSHRKNESSFIRTLQGGDSRGNVGRPICILAYFPGGQ